jgi:hypothetical protein
MQNSGQSFNAMTFKSRLYVQMKHNNWINEAMNRRMNRQVIFGRCCIAADRCKGPQCPHEFIANSALRIEIEYQQNRHSTSLTTHLAT